MPAAQSSSSNRMTMAAYARRIGVSKPALSGYVKRGLPVESGKDEHGRDCKFLNPAKADAWRAANLDLTVDGNGRVRGLVEDYRASDSPPKSEAPSANAAQPSAEARTPPPTATAAEAPSAEQTKSGVGSTAERIQAAKAREAEDTAFMRQLARMKAEGTLVDRLGALAVQTEFVAAMATAIDRMASDQATVIASELGVTQHQAYTALKRVGVRMREDLARYANAAAERSGSARSG